MHAEPTPLLGGLQIQGLLVFGIFGKDRDNMQISSAEIESIVSALEEAPRRLKSMTGDFDNASLQLKPDEDTWSANEILAHLRACDDVWGKSILRMLSDDHPTIRYISPRTWMRKTEYPKQEFHDSLRAFTDQRHELVSSLKTLESKSWSRGATFTGTSKRGREQTVLSYARRIVDHESRHLDQVARVLQAIGQRPGIS